MPVNCSTSALSGQFGSVQFKPSGTQFCLKDFTDFPAGTSITIPEEHDYRVGDPVSFTEEGSSSLDTGLTTGTTYYVVATTPTSIDVSDTEGGTAVTLAGDGGTGTADTPGEGNHIKVSYAEYESVCQVASWSIDLTREEIDVTSLPCSSQNASASKYAPFRTYVPGYVDASGTMTVYFTEDQSTIANRLIQNSLLKSQDGAMAKLYISTGSDDASSLYIEAPIIVLGFSTSVTPGEATAAELNFRVSDPQNVLGLDLTA